MGKLNQFFYVLFLVCLFMLTGCGKEDNPDNPSPINTGNIISKKTIGPEGGVLEGNGFSVTIPPQLLSVPVELTISKLKAEAMDGQAMSDIYFVNNLPASYSGGLTLSYEIPSNANDFSLLLCETPWAPSAKGETISYRLTDYEMNGKSAVVNLQISGYKSGKEIEDEATHFSLGLLAVSGNTSILSSQGHFKITFPVIYEEGAEKLADYLEQAFQTMTQPPYSLSVAKRTRWPIDVTICKLPSTVFGYFEASVLGDNYASLLFNKDKLNDEVNLKATATHELMHFFQSLYDPRNRFSKAKFESPTWWLDEATAVWSEELTATQGASFISAARLGNELQPYAGNLSVKPDEPQNFGYGMSVMIKYIAKNFGGSYIRSIYEKVAAGSKPADAVREALGKFYWEWYGQFMANYTSGSLSSDLTLSVILGSKPQAYKFENSSDTVKAISLAFNPLETKLFKVQIDENALDDESSLGVSSNNPGYEYYAIYKFNNSGIEKIAEGASPTVPNVKEGVMQGYQYLVMVTNTEYSTTSSSARTLDFKIRLSQAPVFRKFSFNLGVMSKTVYVYQSGPGDSTIAAQWHSLDIPTTININGNQISISWNNVDYGGELHTGTFTASLNPDQSMNYQIHDVATNSIAVTTYSSTGYNIPFTNSGWWGKEWSGESHLYIKHFDMKQQFDTFYIAAHGVYYSPEYSIKTITIRFNTYADK